MPNDEKTLTILWVSTEKAAARDTAFLYARDSLLAGWWETVELLLWGGGVELAVTDSAIAEELRLLQGLGCRVSACIACALRYGVADALAAQGIPCLPAGERLTRLLKEKAPLLVV